LSQRSVSLSLSPTQRFPLRLPSAYGFNAESPMPQTGWGRALSEIAGKADDLPADLSLQHDHYLYGTPKRDRAA